MLYAWRGVGKTHVALGIGFAVASGGTFLGWQATAPRRVLYLDGEMPGASLQSRLAAESPSWPAIRTIGLSG
jgi:RecA-family ATPase